MADVRQSIVVGVFNNRTRADEAIASLQKAGFQNDQIRQYAGKGTSPLTGIKSIFASEQRAPGDVVHDLTDMGVAPEDSSFYRQEYEAGHPLVSVASGNRVQEATTILLNHGAYGLQEKRGMGALASSMPMPHNPNEPELRGRMPAANLQQEHLQQEQHMRLHAEQLYASKQRAQVGEVILRKEVVAEQQSIDVPVSHEEVVVERRTLMQDDTSFEPIGEGQTIHIPVSEEQVNLTKRTVTTGEVVVGKRDLQETRHFTDTVKHEEARLEHKGEVPIWERSADDPHLRKGQA